MRGARRTLALALAVAVGAWLTTGGCGRPPSPQVATECGLPPAYALAPFRRPEHADHVLRWGAPHHVAYDEVVADGESAELQGVLGYGTARRHLAGEEVAGYVWDLPCAGPRRAGVVISDRRGRVVVAAGALASGRHPFALRVRGDGSTAVGRVWVVAPARPVVVFDVDGTLTTSDGQLFGELLFGTPALPAPGSLEVARAWAQHGALPVYLTGRPLAMHHSTRRWLQSHGYPDGPVYTTSGLGESRPRRAHVGRYKRRTLERLRARGLRLAAAYGNAATDLCAYAEAGVAPARTFIVGAHAGESCPGHPAPRRITSYAEHLAQVDHL